MENIDSIKDNIKNYTTLRLCEIVVSSRYLGLDEELTIMCMQELSRRRAEENDEFVFENFIDEKLAEMPLIDIRIPDMREMMATLTNLAKKN